MSTVPTFFQPPIQHSNWKYKKVFGLGYLKYLLEPKNNNEDDLILRERMMTSTFLVLWSAQNSRQGQNLRYVTDEWEGLILSIQIVPN